MLIIAAALLLIIGVLHSYLGEKLILIRLFTRDNLPKLMGSDWFTKQTLRFAWHLTTLAWWGFAVILWILTQPGEIHQQAIAQTIAVTFAICGVVSLVAAKGKHFSWVFFLAIAGLCFFAQG